MAIGFNEDLTTEIFLRLPVKSILRFKTVSKLWRSIASSPQFRQNHASRIVNAKGLIFAMCPKQNPRLEFLPLVLPNFFRLFDHVFRLRSSSGGLLLLQLRPCECINLKLRHLRDYFVCNPTTNEFKQLAGIPKLIRDSKMVSETLAFDPCKSPHYKIVFLCSSLANDFQIVIYSSEIEVFNSPQATAYFNYRFCGIYCNDAIHWISYHRSSFYYFDLKTECMKELSLPHNLFKFSQYFGESQGRLHIVTVCPHQISILEVHELKSDYSGWSLKYQVNLASIAKPFPKSEMYSAICNGQFTVFSILVDKGDEENMDIVFLVCGVFVLHAFKRKLSRKLRDDARFRMPGARYDHRDRMYGWPVAHHYIESLACVDNLYTRFGSAPQ